MVVKFGHILIVLVVLMQRSKPAVSVEMKQVIGALCRLLAATGLEAVPTPEIFRQAKFGGGTEVVGSLWLLSLLQVFRGPH